MKNSTEARAGSRASTTFDEFLWREGDLVVFDRSAQPPLPPLCLLTGEPAVKRVTCLFHWREPWFNPGGTPLTSLAHLVEHYFRDVAKVRLAVPLETKLYRRWLWGWLLAGLAGVVAIATICGLWFGQQYIARMPNGPDRKFLRDLGIPLLALGGFAGIAVPMLLAHRVMPMLTVLLVPVRITPDRIWLRGACPAYLEQLVPRENSLPEPPRN